MCTTKVSQKERACRAATLASQIARQRKNHKVLELEDLKDDSEALEDEPEVLGQESIMEEDAFVQFKASIMEDSIRLIKYYRGRQQSRQTIWCNKKK